MAPKANKRSTKQRKVTKTATTTETPALPNEATPSETPAQTAGTKKTKAPKKVQKKQAVEAPAPTPAEVPAKEATGGAKTRARKVQNKKAEKQAVEAQAPVPIVQTEEPTDAVNDVAGTRYFKVIVDGGRPHGRFAGTKPKQAAQKALTSIIRMRKKNGEDTTGQIPYSIVECTRGSKHKEYHYIGERVAITNPVAVQIKPKDGDEKKIVYKFNNRVMKARDPAPAAE